MLKEFLVEFKKFLWRCNYLGSIDYIAVCRESDLKEIFENFLINNEKKEKKKREIFSENSIRQSIKKIASRCYGALRKLHSSVSDLQESCPFGC